MLETTVSKVIKKIKQMLEGEFRRVVVRGEISNLSKSYSGHWYFTLSDSAASLSGVLFKMDATRNPVISKLADGEEVICAGSIGVYAPRGTFQLVVNQIIKDGKGDLLERYELLKQKLKQEGLFDDAHKKAIPVNPCRIALITAKDGAALHDFINIYKRLAKRGSIVVIPALVQGTKSASSLREALRRAQHVLKGIDLIVMTRGGGSIEDLWSFNDEGLARDIFNCNIPVVSAVGHQVDYTICDFVADLRAETPSAAAELVAKEQSKVQEKLVGSLRFLHVFFERKMNALKTTLSSYQPQSSPLFFRLQKYQRRLSSCELGRRAGAIIGINEKRTRLDEQMQFLSESVRFKLLNASHRLGLANGQLEVLNPARILERGYTIIENESGESVASFQQFSKLDRNESMRLHFYDGIGKVRKDD